jgi:nucleoid-associated protein YgaU
MFASRHILRMLVVAGTVLVLWALFANDSGASGPAKRYTVQPGDTLWSIAVERLPGDPREGVWELEQRNRLRSATIVPGQVLVLPS